MRRSLMLFFLLSGLTQQLPAQQYPAPVVLRAGYFDLSAPMAQWHKAKVPVVDLSWKTGIVPNYFNAPSIKAGVPPSLPDTDLPPARGYGEGDSILLNFEGIRNINRVVPPDPHGDVGPDHYFQIVNRSYAVYDKSGSLLAGPLYTSTLWNGMPHNANTGDGVVLYDEQADRWFVSQFALPFFPYGPFYQLIAVSQTPDPLGAWYRWEIAFDELPDYPKFGIWNDGIYMSYSRLRGGTLAYKGTGLAALEREALLNGTPDIRMILFQLPSNNQIFSPLPADCDGDFPLPGTPEYFVYIQYNYLGIIEMQVNWEIPENSVLGDPFRVEVPPFANYTEGIPQPQTLQKLSVLDDRLMYRLQYRKFSDHSSMVTNHTITVGGRTGIRWYELCQTNSQWELCQQGTYAPDTNYRWMGSIAMDTAGNMALGYSLGGAALYPSIAYTGRMKTDPPDQMTIGERRIVEGGGAQTGIWSGQGRWGDYSSMAVDPAAPATFWYTQEYYDTTSVMDWKTRIVALTFSHVLSVNAFSPTPAICREAVVQLDAEVHGGYGTYVFNWQSIPPGFNSALQNPRVLVDTTTRFVVKVSDENRTLSDTLLIEVFYPPDVTAGNDTTWCIDSLQVGLKGTASNASYVRWSTMGDGFFHNRYNILAWYQPGKGDRAKGWADLILTAYPVSTCPSVSDTVRINLGDCVTDPEDNAEEVRLEVKPNPVKGEVVVRVTGVASEVSEITVFSATGQLLESRQFTVQPDETLLSLDISHLPAGLYVLKVENCRVKVVKR